MSSVQKRVVILHDDPIGPQVVRLTTAVLDRVSDLSGTRIEVVVADADTAASSRTIGLCRSADAVLLGLVSEWAPYVVAGEPPPTDRLLALRRALGLEANLRPVMSVARLDGTVGRDVLDCACLWQHLVHEQVDAPRVEPEALHALAATPAMDLAMCSGLSKTFLAERIQCLAGALGLLPCGWLTREEGTGLYEPLHGHGGEGHPLGSVLVCSLLLRHSLSMPLEAASLDAAVDRALSLAGDESTEELSRALLDALDLTWDEHHPFVGA